MTHLGGLKVVDSPLVYKLSYVLKNINTWIAEPDSHDYFADWCYITRFIVDVPTTWFQEWQNSPQDAEFLRLVVASGFIVDHTNACAEICHRIRDKLTIVPLHAGILARAHALTTCNEIFHQVRNRDLLLAYLDAYHTKNSIHGFYFAAKEYDLALEVMRLRPPNKGNEIYPTAHVSDEQLLQLFDYVHCRYNTGSFAFATILELARKEPNLALINRGSLERFATIVVRRMRTKTLIVMATDARLRHRVLPSHKYHQLRMLQFFTIVTQLPSELQDYIVRILWPHIETRAAVAALREEALVAYTNIYITRADAEWVEAQ